MKIIIEISKDDKNYCKIAEYKADSNIITLDETQALTMFIFLILGWKYWRITIEEEVKQVE